MQYINCKKYAQEILDAVKAIPNKKKLVILSVGDNPASESYVKGKIRDCEYCGIPYEHLKLETQTELGTAIANNSMDDGVGGIIVQLPLPETWDESYFTSLVRENLDVDGFVRDSHFKPCTPEGIMYLLHKELGDLTGKHALVIGRGKLVGEPIAKMLLEANCTVTVAHSKTKNLAELLQTAEIIVSAVGKPDLVNLEYCWDAEIVIDAGISKNANGKLVGDCCNFVEDANPNLKVTPVPGGVGLMTRAMLMAHVARLDVNTL